MSTEHPDRDASGRPRAFDSLRAVAHLNLVDDLDLFPQELTLGEFDGIASGHVRVLDELSAPADVPIAPAGGPDVPDWWPESQHPDISKVAVLLFAAGDAYVWPGFGTVAKPSGEVSRATHQEASYVVAHFADMPSIGPDTPEIGPCVVTMPWGGTRNYGHFVLDCLPSVRLALNTPSLSSHRYIFPPLREWHRDHLRIAGLTDWDEIDAGVIRSSAVVYSSMMDHYLHYPGQPVIDVREHQLAVAGPAQIDGARLFLARGTGTSRNFENEAEVADALGPLGFTSLNPAGLSVEEQIRLFRGASAIVVRRARRSRTRSTRLLGAAWWKCSRRSSAVSGCATCRNSWGCDTRPTLCPPSTTPRRPPSEGSSVPRSASRSPLTSPTSCGTWNMPCGVPSA